MENRHGLIADAMVTHADGDAERDAALLMLHMQWKKKPNGHRTVAADKTYATRFCADCPGHTGHSPCIAKCETQRRHCYRWAHHPACWVSDQPATPPLIERSFGWMTSIGWIRKVKLRGVEKVDWLFVFACSAFNFDPVAKDPGSGGGVRPACTRQASPAVQRTATGCLARLPALRVGLKRCLEQMSLSVFQ
jgi:hypothetical protein